MTSAVGSRGTSAGSTCIGNSSLTVGVAGLAVGAAVGGAGADGVIVKEGDEKNWGGS